MANARQVAQWTARETRKRARLPQTIAVRQIRAEFGDEFVYRNKNGNFGIVPAVIKVFNELTKDTIVWSSGSRYWRMRKDDDPAGRTVRY